MPQIPDIQGRSPLGFSTLARIALRTTSALAFASMVPAGAWAQAGQVTLPPATSAAAPASTDDEIVVTARRREENLLTTPVSATVLSGADLDQQNVRGFQDLRGAVSNVELVPLLSGGTSFTVRGIGQTSNQVNADSKAGFYVDEMYVSRQEGNDLYFYDVASLQVLKGPQGTLFGKNTTAGAVLLTTRRPDREFGGYAKVRIGSFRRLEAEGAINIPIAEGLYGRLSVRTQDANGYIRHVVDDGRSGDIDSRSVRAQVRAESGALTFDLLGEYNQSNTDGGATIPVSCNPAAPYTANYNRLHSVPYCTAYPVLGKEYLVYGGSTLLAPTSAAITDRARGGDANGTGIARYVGRGLFNDTQVYTLNGRLSYAVTDDVELRSITTFRRSKAEFFTSAHNAPNDIYAEFDRTVTRQFTQETNLGGSGLDGRLDFLLGAYYFNQKTTFLQDTGPDWIDPLGYVYDSSLDYSSYAAFAQASFKITPRLEATAGIRYTHDRKRAGSYVFFAGNGASYVIDGVAGTCTGFVGQFIGGVSRCAGAPFTAAQARSWSGTDPKLQLSYRWSDGIFTYLSVGHGYNSGGFNQQLGSQPADGRFFSSYDPERLWSYEAGVKADLADHAVQVSLSGFYQKFTSIQSTVVIPVGPQQVLTRQTQSAADAHQQGVEAEFTLRPLAAVTLRGNFAYLDQAYDRILPGATIGLSTPVNTAPKYTFSAAADYTLRVGRGGTVVSSVDVRGVGAKAACFTPGTVAAPSISNCELPAYALLGFRIDYTPGPDAPWRIGLYGTNVLDRSIQLARTGQNGMGIDRYTPGRPQEFGAELSVRF
jgi:iron complex outermembrane receptor protein